MIQGGTGFLAGKRAEDLKADKDFRFWRYFLCFSPVVNRLMSSE
jgi:hypothetical protein